MSMRHVTILDDDARSLAVVEGERPSPGAGEVRIRVAATAVNRADLLQRRGLYPVPEGASPILGLECSGVIDAVGAGVEAWRTGDRVCALLAGGGYAEYVVLDARLLLPVPDGLDLVDAAALPEAVYTAWLNIWVEAAIAPGETLLVTAAASGIGTVALQMARALGVRAFGTASAGKLDAVRRWGAAEALDRAEPGLARRVRGLTGGRGVDVVLDMVGGAALAEHLGCLAPGGRLVLIGLLGGAEATIPLGRLLMNRQRVIGSVLRSRSDDEKAALTAQIIDRVWPHVAAGTIVPVIDRALPLDEVAAAHAALEQNATVGKVVLRVAD
jgi:putative PIG3 family NAD(P)H quinone oxidoreductase